MATSTEGSRNTLEYYVRMALVFGLCGLLIWVFYGVELDEFLGYTPEARCKSAMSEIHDFLVDDGVQIDSDQMSLEEAMAGGKISDLSLLASYDSACGFTEAGVDSELGDLGGYYTAVEQASNNAVNSLTNIVLGLFVLVGFALRDGLSPQVRISYLQLFGLGGFMASAFLAIYSGFSAQMDLVQNIALGVKGGDLVYGFHMIASGQSLFLALAAVFVLLIVCVPIIEVKRTGEDR